MANKKHRATSVSNFLSMKFERIPFAGDWKLAFGEPEFGGIWYVGGRPGNGKTSFLLQLIKEFTAQEKKVRFYNFEEQESTTMQEAIRRISLTDEEQKRLTIISDVMNFQDIRKELETLRVSVAVFDTIQKAGFTKLQVEELRRDFPGKLIIISSHVLPNGLPEKAPANQVYREASLKIFCDRFRAISQGRYFGEMGYYPIWKEKADILWAEL